jgi:hypothetical protein
MRLSLVSHRHRIYNEPIDMKERRHGYIPQTFLWHGHCYRIHAVERCWTVLKRRPGMGRLCFLVRCAEGTFEVYQNLTTDTWHVHKAQWNKGVQVA